MPWVLARPSTVAKCSTTERRPGSPIFGLKEVEPDDMTNTYLGSFEVGLDTGGASEHSVMRLPSGYATSPDLGPDLPVVDAQFSRPRTTRPEAVQTPSLSLWVPGLYIAWNMADHH